MRNQWLRLLLLRCHAPSQSYVSQAHHLRSFTSAILHPRAPHVTPKPFPSRHHFTSSPEPAVHPPEPLSDEAVLLLDAFAKSGSSGGTIITLDLDPKNVSATDDLIFSVFTHPDTDADVAKRIFVWVLESQNLILSSRIRDWTEESGNGKWDCKVWEWFMVEDEEEVELSSEAYNFLLKVLSGSGLVKDTRHLIETMTSIGYCVSKDAFIEISANTRKCGFSDDIETLEYYYSLNTGCFRVTNIVTGQVWGDDVEKQLQEVGPELFRSRCMASKVLERLEKDPNKALNFFRWLEGFDFFEHDRCQYDAMARLLSNEDHTEKFWRFVNEMRSKGHDMYTFTYDHILQRFVERKMMKDAVDLYEFALVGRNVVSPKGCIFLLENIVVGEELDMDLFSKVLGVFKASGDVLTDTDVDWIIESLTSVGKLTECNRILLALKEHGYVPSASKLSEGGKTGEEICDVSR